MMGVTVQTTRDAFDEGLGLLVDAVTSPTFDPVDVELERRVSLAELELIRDDPVEQVEEAIVHAAWGNHPLARPVIGSARSLRALTPQALRAHHRTMTAPGRVLAAVVGDVEPDVALRHLRRLPLDRVPTPPQLPPLQWRGRHRFLGRAGIDQAHARIAFPTMASGDPDVMVLTVLNRILGVGASSRLFQRLREDEGLTYDIWSATALRRLGGMLEVGWACTPDVFPEVRRLVVEELGRCRTDVGSDEVEVAKEGMMRGLVADAEVPSARCAMDVAELLERGAVGPHRGQRARDHRQRLPGRAQGAARQSRRGDRHREPRRPDRAAGDRAGDPGRLRRGRRGRRHPQGEWRLRIDRDIVVEVLVLASGSSGNAALVSLGGTSVLVDVGVSALQVRRRLEAFGRSPAEPAAVLLTHEHSDHVRGLEVLLKKHGHPVWATAGTWAAIDVRAVAGGELVSGRSMRFGDLTVTPVATSHDAREPVAFLFEDGRQRVALCTDTGIFTHLLEQRLCGCDLLLLEANHDRDLLYHGRYPWPLKQRIASRLGHLGNHQTVEAVERLRSSSLRAVVGLHLSAENNTPGLVCETLGGCVASGIPVAAVPRTEMVRIVCEDGAVRIDRQPVPAAARRAW
jgi:phosphoribosyl 1,2-cyclic phosphodiesterase